MAIQVLSLLGQAQQDPASGAARSQLTWCRLLADRRLPDGSPEFCVRALGTTASDAGGLPGGAEKFLRDAGFSVQTSPLQLGSFAHRVLRFQDRGIACTLLDTGGHPAQASQAAQNALDHLLDEAIVASRPDVAMVFGGQPADFARFHALREAGTRVLFGLHNHGYASAPRAFFSPAGGIDAVFTPSEFLRARYAHLLAVPAAVFLPPLDPLDLPSAGDEDRVFLTFVNPSADKGLFFFVRFADELARRRPDLPMLVVESRAGCAELLAAAQQAGIDLTRHDSLMLTPGVARPSEFYALTRLLLVPSVWEEPAGRVVLEAMASGIPPLVSDRGGLPETAGDGGIVLPLPASLRPESREVVTPAAVEPWIEAVVRLSDDSAAYATAVARSRAAAKRALPAAQLDRFAALVRELGERTG